MALAVLDTDLKSLDWKKCFAPAPNDVGRGDVQTAQLPFTPNLQWVTVPIAEECERRGVCRPATKPDFKAVLRRPPARRKAG